MANSTTTKKKTTNTKTTKTAKAKAVDTSMNDVSAEAVAEVVEEAVEAVEEVETVATSEKITTKIIPKDIDPSQYVVVRNGFQGRLIYKSPKTGEKFVWNGFGDEQDMELQELRSARSSAKKFFQNNWFMFDEDWIVDYLGMSNFYKHAVPIDEFDELFTKKASEVKEIIEGMSDGQKRSVAYRASQLIASGDIDSLSVIHTLEDTLGIQLIEK